MDRTQAMCWDAMILRDYSSMMKLSRETNHQVRRTTQTLPSRDERWMCAERQRRREQDVSWKRPLACDGRYGDRVVSEMHTETCNIMHAVISMTACACACKSVTKKIIE